MIEKTFLNPTTNKQWRIEMYGINAEGKSILIRKEERSEP